VILLSNSFEAHRPRTWQPVFFCCWVLYQENPEFPKKIPAALASVFFHTFLNNNFYRAAFAGFISLVKLSSAVPQKIVRIYIFLLTLEHRYINILGMALQVPWK